MMSRLIWICAVCKSLLISPVAVKGFSRIDTLSGEGNSEKLFCLPSKNAFILKGKKKIKKYGLVLINRPDSLYEKETGRIFKTVISGK